MDPEIPKLSFDLVIVGAGVAGNPLPNYELEVKV